MIEINIYLIMILHTNLDLTVCGFVARSFRNIAGHFFFYLLPGPHFCHLLRAIYLTSCDMARSLTAIAGHPAAGERYGPQTFTAVRPREINNCRSKIQVCKQADDVVKFT